ncbi:hypothetical protein FK531_14915 [Rhodococcus spelaei]|uniref:Uncharacterized protein n=1 Tax=Rhodococcus spelaei TaxID=2546320 RepID=A0A541B7U8_9NOCA|nr:hypothetical protein [Rhodococcus spelaei]TQF68373.1 hypothetical protein FK531_14915 [Rhodococcus spelaei]
MLAQLASFTPELLDTARAGHRPPLRVGARRHRIRRYRGTRRAHRPPDAYRGTAIMAVEAATRLASDDFKPGALAPPKSSTRLNS